MLTAHQVHIEVEENGSRATLTAVENQSEAVRAVGLTPPIRLPLGVCHRNEYGWWVSHTPLGDRYYSNAFPCGWDAFILAGWKNGKGLPKTPASKHLEQAAMRQSEAEKAVEKIAQAVMAE